MKIWNHCKNIISYTLRKSKKLFHKLFSKKEKKNYNLILIWDWNVISIAYFFAYMYKIACLIVDIFKVKLCGEF